MRPRAVFFDLDDTLIDRAGAFARYLEDLLSRHPAAFPPERRDQDVATLHALDARGSTERTLFFRQVTLAFPGLSLSAEALWEDFAHRLPSFIQPQPGIRPLVEWVKSRFMVAVVSNGSSRMQRAKLARAGLEDVLPDVFLSGEVGASKPDPRIFTAALAHVGCAPAEVLHVGDDPVRDIAGATRVGMASCWISGGRDWPNELPPPTLTVSRVDELLQVL
ncbi:haloacid dehalogenase [Cystobacter fuscus]|uniref:Haloacid dehalogenase n=1 Tax=Cystobacter fuscus TaxID=43 RepID=A0A250J0X3_9BACT|nr:HAD family hydrolase [Cystobacter fuscus]ATB37132.1 haloacid dehalogenase [Cystobacter fuscus]